MQTPARPLTELVRDLPFSVEQEVRDFVEFLLTKHERQPGKKLRQDWAGALEHYRQEYTSVQLQEQALDWRDQ
ncbi:MAG TPA: DUF2281 domain-containing protein [Anaerolineae bacterium]|nr:DUF2281 domain-containing protein [Anaerolineae bacterium]MCB0004614.1 DUF2281 domain-containing protein [Anaerolineae bacterium]HRX05297.1 DUF2281 domain-containing protein [Anaerolineae bacterium]